MITESWVSLEDVAKHLGLVRKLDYRWVGRRDLPVGRIGRAGKVRPSGGDRWGRAVLAAWIDADGGESR